MSNVVDVQSFHIGIPKVKYLRTWNFPPKCPPSTSSSSGKDFENLLNTFGDTGFLLAQWTRWNWQNFKCFPCAKFSPWHCKNEMPAHLKLSTQMPTHFELRQRFRKSVEYHWRYRIFVGTVYKLKVAKFQMLSMLKVFAFPGILLLQWQGENFARRQNLKFCHFQLVHCASKNPISPMVFNRFSKSLPRLEDV